MLDKYKELQSSFYNYFVNSFKLNKISHAYLIESNGYSSTWNLVLDLVKFILGNDKMDFENNPDIVIIDNDEKEIKKEQVLSLQKLFSSKPLFNKYQIYIIKNTHLLNKSSANTILKFLEEPNENIIAILVTDNIYRVIETIISRCQIVSLHPDLDILTCLVNKSEEEVSLIIDFYNRLEFNKTKILLDFDVYLFKDKIKQFLEIGLYLYLDILNILLKRKNQNIDGYNDIKEKIAKTNNIDDIINKIDLINQFVEKSNYNVNRELFIDNFVITIAGGIDSD